MQDDSYYIKEVLRGDKHAYSFLINRYSNKLYAVILRMVKNPEDAKDLVLECLIKAYSQLEKYENTGSFASWLYRLSINHCMDQFRKKRFQLVELQEEPGQSNSAATPESEFLQKERYEHLEKLLELLPQEDRMILLMKYTRDLSYEEISELVGQPISTVRNKIHRAKKKMRKQLMEQKGGYFHEML